MRGAVLLVVVSLDVNCSGDPSMECSPCTLQALKILLEKLHYIHSREETSLKILHTIKL